MVGFVEPFRIAGMASGWTPEAITIPLVSGLPTMTSEPQQSPSEAHSSGC